MSLLRLIFALGLFTSTSSAQNDPGPWGYTDILRKTGQLVSVEITPQSTQLRVYVVGNQVSDFNFKNLILQAYSRRARNKQRLPVIRESRSFLIEQPPPGSDLILEIQIQNRREQIEIPPPSGTP